MINVDYLVKTGLYKNEKDVFKDAIQQLLLNHPDFRIKIALFRYRNEDISLAKAAKIAGVTSIEMKNILTDNNIKLKLGIETIDELKEEVNMLKNLF